MLKVSIIILVWNGKQYLTACLNAVLTQNYPDFEVIVVDNASTDSSADFVVANFPQVKLIRNAQNLGYAGGNNIGLQATTGDVLVLLNQDTEVTPNWLTELVKPMLADPAVGITGGKALYPDGIIQHAGGYVNEYGEGHHYGYRQPDDGQFDQLRDVDYVTGAGLALTRRVYNAIGGLDESFFPAYYEDVDWCCSAQRAGFRVVYAPKAVFIHKEESSLADQTHNGLYLPHRNRIRFVFKQWSLERLSHQFLSSERAWLRSLAPSGEKLIAALRHVYLYHLLHLSELMTLRQTTLNAPLDETDDMAGILLNLRAITPVAEIFPNLENKQNAQKVSLLEDLYQSKTLQPYQFHSDVPVMGRAIAAFRRLWYQVSAKWGERSLINQQNSFNAQMVALLILQDRKIVFLENRLSEYIAENGREIDELALTLREFQLFLLNQTMYKE